MDQQQLSDPGHDHEACEQLPRRGDGQCHEELRARPEPAPNRAAATRAAAAEATMLVACSTQRIESPSDLETARDAPTYPTVSARTTDPTAKVPSPARNAHLIAATLRPTSFGTTPSVVDATEQVIVAEL